MVISSSRDKPETLNELSHLRDSKFGQPHPRHGLRLLYWLAHDCFSFYPKHNLATLLCEPKSGDYGFHYFGNRENDLPAPAEEYVYYEVGNLNEATTQHLPYNVSKNYNRNQTDSNSDRIILSVGPRNIIDKIYATKHLGKGSFDRERTYRISKGLMIIIKQMELSEFLGQMSRQAYMPPTVVNIEPSSPNPNSPITVPESCNPTQCKKGFWGYCTIL